VEIDRPDRAQIDRPDRAQIDRQFADDGGKKELVTGEITYKPLKPLRGECRMIPVPPL
jgi:hypothetical protein